MLKGRDVETTSQLQSREKETRMSIKEATKTKYMEEATNTHIIQYRNNELCSI
jgi:hypothetical protein